MKNILKNRKATISKILSFLLITVLIIFIISCAGGPNDFVKTPNMKGETAGFFQGLWHGFIALFSFIVSLFNDKVNIYEIHNNGGLYNLGFIIGVSAFFGSSGGAGSKAYKWKKK